MVLMQYHEKHDSCLQMLSLSWGSCLSFCLCLGNGIRSFIEITKYLLLLFTSWLDIQDNDKTTAFKTPLKVCMCFVCILLIKYTTAMLHILNWSINSCMFWNQPCLCACVCVECRCFSLQAAAVSSSVILPLSSLHLDSTTSGLTTAGTRSHSLTY